MTFGRLAWHNLSRRPLRSVFAAFGIGLAVATAIALVSLSRGITDTVKRSIDERGAALTITQRGLMDVSASFLPAGLEKKISKVPGIVDVAPEMVQFAPMDHQQEVLVAGWPDTSYFWRQAPLSEGRIPSRGERRVAVLGDEVAVALGKHVNDRLDIMGVAFRVVGVTRYKTALNRRLVIVPLPDLQHATYREGQVTVFHARVSADIPPERIESIREQVARLGVSAYPTSEVMGQNRYIETFNAISLVVSSIAITIGILNVLNTLLFAVQERTREIGILSAIGWSESRIAALIVTEGMMLCATGSMLGIGLGFLACALFGAIPVVGNYVTFTPTFDLVAPTAAAALGLCVLGTLYPAWRATQCTPAGALQRI